MWYKDAIIYELHVRSFFDLDGDGIGDFKGLIAKLDYLSDLGVTALWLLPFYPSPLRDDGYDIADYKNIHPDYGTLADFDNFINAAHQRNLRVITELVINHTSIDHPWFQASRRARPGEKYDDYYLWSPNQERYKEARIIFKDCESSNWKFDELRKEFFWHRFFSHQPDLNFENENVQREIFEIIDFWLGKGVDGLRLDAVPYLFEQEGSTCENLPKTHEFLKKIRSYVDRKYANRLLLAEANQWPKEAVAYFGNGDECHMCFHFPLMPRLFMALGNSNRQPLDSILQATPAIPSNCQWAIFLRNHDELTLEMVTEEERISLLSHFAKHTRSSLNVGIRHRLAPLLGNDQRQIELLLQLLFSLPGTPVIYYGDEIAMGDDVFLNDRDGVRTPMQWSSDQNAGFSTADPRRLYLPVITNHPFHYEAVNVESAQKNPHSLFHFFKNLIRQRQANPALSRGDFKTIDVGNSSVFAFMRSHGFYNALIVANLSERPQIAAVNQHNLSQITIGPYGCIYFDLSEKSKIQENAVEIAEFSTHALLEAQVQIELEKALPSFLEKQRWFSGKTKKIQSAIIRDLIYDSRNISPDFVFALVIEAKFLQGHPESYIVYIAHQGISSTAKPPKDNPDSVIVKTLLIEDPRDHGILYDAFGNQEAIGRFFQSAIAGRLSSQRNARISFSGLSELEKNSQGDFITLKCEQSNSSLIIDSAYFLKAYRKIEAGVHPEIELCQMLSQQNRFSHTPMFMGSLHYENGDSQFALGLCTQYFSGAHDGLDFIFEAHAINQIAKLTGEMHLALSSDLSLDDFRPEPITSFYLDSLCQSILGQLDRTLIGLLQRQNALNADLRNAMDELIAHKADLATVITRSLSEPIASPRIRVHGDYHLGQILVSDAGLSVVDFEGDPARPLAERRIKRSCLYDLASMIRSFDYAGRLRQRSKEWAHKAEQEFVSAYCTRFSSTPFLTDNETLIRPLLNALILEKNFREIQYELNWRPNFLHLPLFGLIDRLRTVVAQPRRK